MKTLNTIILALMVSFGSFAQDTFSIIAVDPTTGEIGSAGASCVQGVGSMGIIDIITDIIPGRGGVNSQAYVCIPNTNLQNAIDQMEMGSSPQEIIDWLLLNDACGSQGFDPAYRQYGIADLDMANNPRTAGWSGASTDDYKEDRQGATYSIQGNILLDVSVIDNMEDNFNNTNGTLADKLMAAMQGANFAGADSRCLADGTSSTTAYLLVYKADDDPNDPYIRLNIGQQPAGTEPIDLLQTAYDNFLGVDDNLLNSKIVIAPNPVKNQLALSLVNGVVLQKLSVLDVNGKEVQALLFQDGSKLNHEFNVSDLSVGMYFLKVATSEGTVTKKFIKK